MILDNIIKSIIVAKIKNDTDNKDIFTIRIISTNPEYTMINIDDKQHLQGKEVLTYKDYVVDREYLEQITNDLRKQLE